MHPPKPKPIPSDWWVCACVKRWPNGDLRSIRLHLATVPKCDDCNADRPDLWHQGSRNDTPPAEQPTEADA